MKINSRSIFTAAAVAATTFAMSSALSSPAWATLGQATDWQLGLQEPASPTKLKMEHFHNDMLLPLIVAISIFVMLLLIYVMLRFNTKTNPTPSKTTHNTLLEVIWTGVPVLILVLLVIPSMKLLYFADKSHNPEMTLKVTGYQWYWGYEYPDHGGINFSANMKKDEELAQGEPRLLATDNAIVLPVDTDIQILTTASDVIHSWAVPAFGIKIDAVPGRTNETWVRIDKEGTFYGQCSEICGNGHGFMPIQVKAVSKEAFAEWVKAQGGKMPAPKAAAAVEGAAVAATPASEKPAEEASEDKAEEQTEEKSE